MKKYILLLLSFISLTAYSQTVSNLPSGAKPYGNQLYIMPSTGDIWSGNAGYKYRVLAKKSYVDSLTTLGYKKTQIDSLLALKASVTYVSNEITNTVNYINSGLALKENVITATTSADYYRGDKVFATLNKTAVGLSNVDNTSDANKPVSTAQQTALNLKANIASPTFTGTVSGITKAMVGLSNVDNTSDLNKPISTTTQSALDLKINTSLIGANSGVASLDVNGKVPLTQINDALLGAVKYQSSYDASTNTPALPSASSSKGFYYVVSVGGTQQGLTLLNGDWIISNGTIWQKVDNNSLVNSVNGQVGDVNITTITGNAGTATTLETPRTIWGQSFNGSANVTGALTGATTINASSTVTAPTFVGSLTGNATTATNSGIWDGGPTGLTASTGRTSLGGTTIGQNLFTLTNPSAITFPRFNADNSVSSLSASAFKTAIGVADGWGLTGNAGTNSSNFIGTTDQQDLVFKTGNVFAGRITTYAKRNISFGQFANESNGGVDNIAIGVNSLHSSSLTGSSNVGVGYATLRSNTTGYLNVGVGWGALHSNTTGTNSVAIGNGAMFSMISGNHNVAIGDNALYSGTSAIQSVAIGANALSLSTGANNTSIGMQSGYNITTGYFNTTLGAYAYVADPTGTGQLNISNGIYGTGLTQQGASPNTSGRIGILKNNPETEFDVSGTSQATKFKLSALNTAPSSATDTGTTGEIRITATYIYVCTATNTWVRSALTTW